MYLSVCFSIYLSICLFFYLSIYLFIYLSIYLSYLSISIYPQIEGVGGTKFTQHTSQ